MDGICLKCAFESDLPGLDQLFSRAGITEDNIDEITARMNEVLASKSAKNPEDLLKGLLSSDFTNPMRLMKVPTTRKPVRRGHLCGRTPPSVS